MLVMSVTVLLLMSPALVTGMCPYIDAHWRVNYNHGLKKFHEDNSPEPPLVTQVGPARWGEDTWLCVIILIMIMNWYRIRVTWGHLVKDVQCVDRLV